MFKVMFFLKRKPGTSVEEFRRRLERHVEMSMDRFGDLLIEHHRNYPSVVMSGRANHRRQIDWPYDCISEWFLRDEAAFAAILKLLDGTEAGKELLDDANEFLDGSASMQIRCGEVEVMRPWT